MNLIFSYLKSGTEGFFHRYILKPQRGEMGLSPNFQTENMHELFVQLSCCKDDQIVITVNEGVGVRPSGSSLFEPVQMLQM